MESNGGADESSRLLRELESSKESKREIESRISVIESQIQKIKSNNNTNNNNNNNKDENIEFRYSRQFLLPYFVVQGQSNLLKSSIPTPAPQFDEPQFKDKTEQEADIEPEPEGSRRRRKGKKPAKELGKKAATKTPWTTEEERLLTECFIDVSEDPRRGTSQSGAAFWGRIQEKYNAGTAIQRTKDQLSSKWRQIRIDVGNFVTIYSGYDKNRRNGEDDLQVMEQSRKVYLLDVGKVFNMYDCFRILKDKPKFLAAASVDVMGRSLSKRKSYINLDECEDENVNLDDPPTEHELFGRDLIERPGGRNKSQRHSGSSDAMSSRSSHAKLQATLDRLGNKRVELYDTKKTALERIVEEEKKRTMFAAFSFLESGTPNEEERRFLQKAKKSVMNEYKHLIQDSDDED